MTANNSKTAEIRRLARTDEPAALKLLDSLLRDLFGLDAHAIAINRDQYSLNSLNGFFEADGQSLFFKFHQEDGEEAMSGEYYRADILLRAGLPVDQALYMSVLPGEQILVYRRRSDPRFSDVLRALDLAPDEAAEAKAVAAERQLSETVLSVYLETLHAVTPTEVAAEPIHRLFHDRLADPLSGAIPGGRFKSFYVDQEFSFPGVNLDWDAFSIAPVVVNGRRYRYSFGDLFEQAGTRLRPDRLADAGGVVAHGDAHNANVWYTEKDGAPLLSYFDPAFAGQNVPTLLAEVKTTFHNILAHPLWLYDPAEAQTRYTASARYEAGTLFLDTDWEPSRVRMGLLEVKADTLWRPLLAALKERGMLPNDWRRVIRLALFLCPTLVMNIRAGASTHNKTSSLIAVAIAVMAGSEPETGEDIVSLFLDRIDPSLAG
ncbi:hypothetical protein [Pararhizobium antarcticum]|uniref:Aminoglycoside phosphotransferase domain-containing protein n=1 Tax=Pararhizobium antarcticum TaxID=1798805 RepID=A0A657LSB9_9HYPH|nr:hypothetical protein [Pararhizobium antarcticum]OJF92566.1 hypothetical protein AX760_22445 [Pararhizobium antarcticum]OJF95833.1 hypothetical protein AX761_16990 [Rhizobium sp. 58]